MFPQLPQFAGSVLKLTQAPLQATAVPQLVWHWPPPASLGAHTWPDPHTAPPEPAQPPQFNGSVVMSVQVPLH
jgi:hypothetical protein